ncbi:MAG: alanine racemase [Pseudomonadota bacterium]
MKTAAPAADLQSLSTPTLLLDRNIMRGNLRRMADHITGLGGVLRPHVKTHKSRDVAGDVKAAGGIIGVTVSTLNEAAYFFEAGHNDILYAVGMTPNKVAMAADLIKKGCTLTVVTDNEAMVALIAEQARAHGVELSILIELDVDGHRSGIDPNRDDLLPVARAIATTEGVRLKGVMAHAGGSYNRNSLDAIKSHAEQERALTVTAAERIRADGLDCPVVSIGSSPTALMIDNLDGVTEVRAGVYTFFDLFQTGLGVSKLENIALSVLTTVIGHQPDKNWVIVDAGWMAMSRDRGTEKQAVDQGFGVVCNAAGVPLGDAKTGHIIMGGTSQEHGILMAREGAPALNIGDFPVGTMLRVLPNHACATAAQYDGYDVLEDGAVKRRWKRTNRW